MLHSFFLFVAQLDPSSVPTDLQTGEALELLIKSIGGLKGASALGIAVAITQALMLFFRTPLANFAGKWRLVVLTGLSLVVCVLALRVAGVDWLTALVHSSTLTTAQVFGNQMFKQFKKES